jgi:uncharacterized protein (TIGR04255 family)
MDEFKITVSDKFEHLPRAPIIEALIDFRADATDSWDLPSITAKLKEQLLDYPTVEVQNTWQTDLKIVPGQLTLTNQRDVAQGVQLKSADGHHVANFHPTGFTFSRLQPYEDWEHLRYEAFRLWPIYQTVAKPDKVQRIGLRYINRFEMPLGEAQFEDYINPHPTPPHGLKLPHSGFLHVDTLTTPGYPYLINMIQTIQPPQPPGSKGYVLILDIDVFTFQTMEAGDSNWLRDRLAEMRWLKNKVFFGSVTSKALESFK